jgi:hypothetical protein
VGRLRGAESAIKSSLTFEKYNTAHGSVPKPHRTQLRIFPIEEQARTQATSHLRISVRR